MRDALRFAGSVAALLALYVALAMLRTVTP